MIDPAWYAANVLVLIWCVGSVLAYRERLQDLQQDFEDEVLDNQWRRVTGTIRERTNVRN